MLVTLIGKNCIRKIILPPTPEGSYWISDKTSKSEKKLVNIEGKYGNWQIVSNSYTKIINSQCISLKNDEMKIIPDEHAVISKIILKKYSMYFVGLENSDDAYVLYCSDVYEQDMLHFDIKDFAEITIGKDAKSNDISYNHILVKDRHARIFYENNTWKIENFDKKYGTFVNNIPIFDNIQTLKNGDIIFIMGLKIIVIGNSIYVNNPLDKMRYLLRALLLNKEEVTVENTKDDDENDEIELYTEKDYFSRAPRIVNKIEREKVEIDPPPKLKEDDEMPAILTMGSSLSMGVMMMISMYSTIDGLVNKTATMKESILKFSMSFAMLIAMLVFPILTKRYQKRQKKKYEKKRQQRYKKYINSKIVIVNEIMDKQRKILNENYVSSEECQRIVLEKDSRLWERKMEDHEFLSIRAGIGDVPLDIDVSYPKESFTMEDDNLVEILNTIAQKSKILENAPISVSLTQKNISSVIVQNDQKKQSYMKNLILQLVALHSYMDLKIVFLVKEDKQNKWEYVKMLPHIWNATNQIRFFADDYNDMKQISKYLEEILENRAEHENEDIDYKQFAPYYLIITDDYKKIENLKIITDVLKMRKNLGFSLLCITNDLTQLPNECKTFITIEDKIGKIFESENSSTTQKEFTFDVEKEWNFPEISKVLFNIPIKYSTSGSMLLPTSYTFLEMYDVGRIEQLNVLDRWTNNDPTISLQAPIGIDATGMQISLDIHEKYHGPHGLIAGSTGSGKSEFIITYILSLAINYHPDDVNFVLIDYKGGGLAGAFQKRDIKLPHLVGTITNIDTVGLQRSLDSIQSELRKRQISFNKARDLTEESTIDIYKYQKLYHEGIVNKPIPHLFIICDEFAELKQQQPEFMDELISVARIGRSLGVHLILATQKPAGIVNEQIRSNSKFGICLKVQDRSDSVDVIKKPDAAKLKKAGQFYMNVGNDEYFTLGQSAWAGAQYFPSDVTKKEIDTSIEFISNLGTAIKKINNTVKKKNIKSEGDQLTNIVEYVCQLAKDKDIKEEQLWLDSIPQTIFIKKLKNKYNIKTEENIINPVIGEYDDPSNQKQGILTINLSQGGNTIIYGSADSGKETLLTTMVYDIITTHTTTEAQLYLLDFGSEILKVYTKTPHVGDIVLVNDNEKVMRLFEMIRKEIDSRKKILSEYNGDYNLYINTSGKTMPMIVIVLNNYGAFSENYNNYEDELQILTRDCTKCGIVFIVTANSYRDLRYRLVQNFKQKLALQLNNEDDYLYIFDKLGKKRPSHMFGRGLVPLDNGKIYEFQTAKICKPEHQNEYINAINEKLSKINKISAKPIPTLPNVVKPENVKKALKSISSVPIGIIKKSLNICTYDFKKNLVNIITSKDIDDSIQFLPHLLDEIGMLKNVDITIFDKDNDLAKFANNYNAIIEKLRNNSNTKEDKKFLLCVIVDIEKFIGFLGQGKDEFESLIQNAEKTKNCSFIIVESATRLKNHQFDNWYKNYVANDTGIWIGNGVDNQYVISAEINRREIISNCGNSFGYVIKQGNTTFVKLLGIEEKEDENE